MLDIIADHNLHQVTDKPTRNERTLDLLLMNNPSNLNKLCTLPPIGLADPTQIFFVPVMLISAHTISQFVFSSVISEQMKSFVMANNTPPWTLI
jgi:hypothetical protein